MVSSSNSRSASPSPSQETVQIFIKNISGESKDTYCCSSKPPEYYPHDSMTTRLTALPNTAIPLTVPSDLTITNLTNILSLRNSLPPSSLRLVYAGKHLSPSSTLEDHHILPESTLHLASPLRGGMPPKKIRCTYKECREGAQRIIGDCGFCQGHFCGKHRLLEDHKCDGLEDCKKESHDRNAAQLNSERTQVIKGI